MRTGLFKVQKERGEQSLGCGSGGGSWVGGLIRWHYPISHDL